MLFLCLFALVFSKQVKKGTCTPYVPIRSLNHEEAQEIYKSGVPIYFRLTFAGCVATPASQASWEEVAQSYPQVNFIEIDCINHGNNQFCYELMGKQGYSTPSHIIAVNGSTIEGSKFSTPEPITKSSQMYQDYLREYLKMSPVDLPMVSLTNKSTVPFYNSNEYTVFLTYNGNCREDMTWLGKWSNAINESFTNYGRVSFGFLDCSKYEYECKRWGSSDTSAIIYKRGGERLKISSNVEESEIGKVVLSRISQLDSSTVPGEIPVPVVTPRPPPPPKPTPTYEAVQNSKLQKRPVNDVKTRYKTDFPKKSNENIVTDYDAKQCKEGTHSKEDIEDSVRVLSLLRYIAGLPEVTNKAEWNQICQKTALSLHNYGQITHEIPENFTNCTGADERKTAKISNLAQGEGSAWESMSGFIRDLGDNNAEEVGHRRWLLFPDLKEFGVGYFPHENKDKPDYLPPITVMKIQEAGSTFPEPVLTDLKFVSWPAAGPFPIDHIPDVWSISYPGFKGESIKDEELVIEITRQDGVKLPVKKHLISRVNKGTADCLIIQMTTEALSYCVVGSVISVKVYIQNHQPLQYIDYSFTIFDNSDDVPVCYYSSDEKKCGQTATKLGTGHYSELPQASDGKRLVITVAESITLTESLSLESYKEVSILGSTVSGKIILGPETKCDIEDPSETEIVLKLTNKPTLKVGSVTTPKEPKSVTVNVTDTPESGHYATRVIYTGPITYIGFTQNKFSDDISDILYGIRSNSTHAVLIYQYVTQLHQFAITGLGDVCGNLIGVYTQVQTNKDIMKYNLNRRTIRLVQCGADQDNNGFSMSNVVKDRALNYELLLEAGNPRWFLNYDYRMDKLIKHLKVGSTTDKAGVKSSITFPSEGRSTYQRNLIDFPITIVNPTDKSSSIYMPKLRGDDMAKQVFGGDDFAIYDDSNIDTQDINNCVLQSKQDNSCQQTHHLFITSDKCHKYIIKAEMGCYSAVMVQPKEGTESHPVTIEAYNYNIDGNPEQKLPTSRNSPLLWLSNYQNLTLKANWNFSSNIRLINIGNYKMADVPDTIKIINVTSESVSLDSDKTVTYEEMSISSSTHISAKNGIAKSVVVSPVSATLSSLEIDTALTLTDSQLILRDCKVSSGSTVSVVKEGEWPTIKLVDGSFEPQSISVEFKTPTSVKLLNSAEEEHLFISGLTKSTCETLKSKIALKSQPTGIKALCSKEGTSIFLTNKNEVESGSEEDDTVVQPDYPSTDIPEIIVSTNTEEGNDKPAITTTKEGSEESHDDSTGIKTNQPGEPTNQPGEPTNQPGETTKELTEDGSNTDDSSKEGLKPGAIAGIVIAVIVVIAVVIIVVVIVFKKKKNYNNSSSSSNANASQLI